MIRRLQLHLCRRWHLWVIAAVSYLPLFATHHGKLHADTKLYLGEDPAGLIARSWFAWDSSQFGGFVPHQAIAYLWPSGPFYVLFDVVGVPQWVTQRLWLGTIFLAAGIGVFVFVRWLMFSRIASLLAAFVFLFSPYVLAYQSRTSSMLLPWAALGWLCYFTARGIQSRSWLWPSLIASVMFTVGSVNATATLMIIPAPILIALHCLPTDSPYASLFRFSWRTTLLTIGSSVWWIAMLSIQSEYGAELLSYSETLESVSSTANAFEVVRGFGYWLNYVDLEKLPLTTGARDIFSSPVALLATTVIPLIAIIALALVRNTHRRLGLWLILVGTFLAVGVYPLDNPSPLFEPLASRPTSSVSLAFRSSTRAIPLLILGLALGIALFVDSTAWKRISAYRLSPRLRRAPVGKISLIGVVGLCLIFSLPSKFTRGAFEPSLERSPIPDTWRNLDTVLARNTTPATRILQIPGQEFGAYTWGYTVDPALPGVTRTGVLTRDLIPLGNETTMNTLWALDDAVREGRLHPKALTTLGRLLSFNTVFLPGDLDLSRYTTTSQESVLTANALTSLAQRTPDTGPHSLIFLPASTGSLVRQYNSTALVLGDGKGIIDTAIADVVDSDGLILAGHVLDTEMQDVVSRVEHVVVTDTHTEKAQQWRTSVDTNGFDEDRSGELINFTRDSGDIRMRIFPKLRNNDRTWFEQSGPVRARASSYGPPLTYRPEHRPFAAIDNNPNTAWTVAHGVEPLAPVLELRTESPVDSLRLLQPTDSPNRIISTISISVDGGDWNSYELGADSMDGGQTISLSAPGTVFALRIDTTKMVRQITAGEELSGVGFAEVKTELGSSTEIGVLPTRGLDNLLSSTPLSYVMTRRVAPIDRDNRSASETSWSRSIYVPSSRSFVVTARIDTTSMSVEERVEAIEKMAGRQTVAIDGENVVVSFSFNDEQQTLIGTSNPITLSDGDHIITANSTDIPIDQIVLSSPNTDRTASSMVSPATSGGLVKKTITLSPCPTGCWVVFGEGHSRGWSASINGTRLPESRVMDGGANGWWLEPFNTEQEMVIEFTPQKTLTAALIVSALFLLCIAVLIIRTRADVHSTPKSPQPISSEFSQPLVQKILFGVLVVLLFAVLFSPLTALLSLVMVTTATILRRLWLFNLAVIIVFICAMLSSWWTIVSTHPELDFDWPSTTSGSHTMLMICLALLASSSLFQRDSETLAASTTHERQSTS